MDQTSLVNHDGDTLVQIAQAFRESGIAVSGIYLIVLNANSGCSERVVRLVMDRKFPDAQREMIHKLVELRRTEKLPKLAEISRFDIVPADDQEASRVLDYARRYGSPPVVIRDTMWKGLFIEYAIVAEVPQSTAVLA